MLMLRSSQMSSLALYILYIVKLAFILSVTKVLFCFYTFMPSRSKKFSLLQAYWISRRCSGALTIHYLCYFGWRTNGTVCPNGNFPEKISPEVLLFSRFHLNDWNFLYHLLASVVRHILVSTCTAVFGKNIKWYSPFLFFLYTKIMLCAMCRKIRTKNSNQMLSAPDSHSMTLIAGCGPCTGPSPNSLLGYAVN